MMFRQCCAPRLPIVVGVVLLLAVASGGGACSRSTPPAWVAGWQTTEPMIVPRTSAAAVIANGYLYVIGGIRGGGIETGFVKSVEFARLQPDGSVKDWRLTSSLTMPRGFLTAVTANGFIYALGGETYRNGLLLLNTVERAKILSTGSLGPWEPVSGMMTPRRSPTAVISHGNLYAIGGYNGLFLRSVERAAIQPDGSLAPWRFLPVSLTTDRYIHGAGLVRDNIYIVGGHIQDIGGGKSSTEWSQVQPDGELRPWQPTETTKTPRFLASTIAVGDFIFTLGGFQERFLDSVERARVLANGSLSPWVETTRLTRPKEGAALAVIEPIEPANGTSRRLYVIGGSSGEDYLRDVEWAVINEHGEPGYWASPSSSAGPSSGASTPKPPVRPTAEEAHSQMGATGPSR